VSVKKAALDEALASSFSLNDQCDARRFLHAKHFPHGTSIMRF
jgi:hypothetical protein